MKKTIKDILFFILIILIVIPCTTCEKKAFIQTIKGVVIDSVYSRPVENLQIRLFQYNNGNGCSESASTYTDEKGEFKLKCSLCRKNDIVISAMLRYEHPASISTYSYGYVNLAYEDLNMRSKRNIIIKGPPLANLTINAYDTSPFINSSDVLNINIDKWFFIAHTGTGNRTYEVRIPGNISNLIGWRVNEKVNGDYIIPEYTYDSIYIDAFESMKYTINY